MTGRTVVTPLSRDCSKEQRHDASRLQRGAESDMETGDWIRREARMKARVSWRLGKIGLGLLLLIGAIICTGCDGADVPPPPPPTKADQQPPPPPSRPDLAISAIEVFPGQPTAGQRFALNVYVRNGGQAASGEYDVLISIRDVSRGSTYPVGTFRREPLQPGENVTAYSSTDRLVNDPGSYQVHVEIRPFVFEDGNEQNNTAIWAFTVN